MGDAGNFLMKVGDFANEVLELAEKRGLTLAETMEVPKVMENILKNELRKQGTTYIREKPQA